MAGFLVFLGLFLGSWGVLAEPANKPVLSAIDEYFDFAEYGEGTISLEQISDDMDIFHVVDTRGEEQYKESHIEGAVNIEWRQIMARRHELPTDQAILLYCDTGLLAARAQLALRLAGHENVSVLWGGILFGQRKQLTTPLKMCMVKVKTYIPLRLPEKRRIKR
jgi:rhodanese-related sulfurtransferase